MFVIVHNGNVILGPMNWNARRFSEVIEEDCDVSFELPLTNDNFDVITVNDDIKIYPVQTGDYPTHDYRFECLHGPFWQFTDTHAVQSFTAIPLAIDASRNFLKDELAKKRWTKQHECVKITINSVEYTFATDVTTKSVFHQYITSGITSVNWKVNQDTWISLSQSDITNIFNAITQHVQTAFDWENNLAEAINNATTETITSLSLE